MNWINVKDRFPTPNKSVLTYTPNMGMPFIVQEYCAYYGEDDDEWYEHWQLREGVTHWMSISKPPKENNNDKI